MKNLQKNNEFKLKYEDPANGFGLFYSEKKDRVIIANTLTTAVWKNVENTSILKLQEIINKCISKSLSNEQYLLNFISELKESPLFHSELGKRILKRNNDLKIIYYYITNNCNASCYHCYLNTANSNIKLKDNSSEIVDIINQSINEKVEYVKITGGEPLLVDNFEWIIENIDSKAEIGIETNGFLINEKIADTLKKCNVQVSISLDASNPEFHNKLRGQKDSFQRVINAINILHQRNIFPSITMTVSNINLTEVGKVVNLLICKKCNILKINPIMPTGNAKRYENTDIELKIEQIIKLVEECREIEKNNDILIYINLPPSFLSLYQIFTEKFTYCPFDNILGIFPDGSLSTCAATQCYPELILGNLNTTELNIIELWNESRKINEIRKQRKETLNGVCNNCLLSNICQVHCPAFAFSKYNSLNGPNPWCQMAFERGYFPQYFLKE